jgi:1,2-dihydroxy-3-keto-5-methylthiopentene dioxygenase
MQAAWVGEKVVQATEDELRAEGLAWGFFAPTDPGPLADQLGDARGFNDRCDVKRAAANPKDEAENAKEADEHAHVADEVRLFLEGEVVYDIRAIDGARWLRVWLRAGEVLVIPERRYHRLLVPARRSLRYLEVYGDAASLLPLYRVSDEATRAI